MDGFGRTTRVETGAASGTWGYNFSFTPVSAVDTQYTACGCSPLGKVYRVSQPYTSGGSASAWTTYTYDATGRTITVTVPDGSSATTYAYSGNTVTVTDPASKWKTFAMDAFGNLTTVTEPNPQGGANLLTTYTYDVLNHLTKVTMPRTVSGTQYTQTRTFVYNLGATVTGFLQSATNPENGTVSYTYNSQNLLTSKTDAKNQQIQYSYDAYNRLYQIRHYPTAGGSEDMNQQVNFYYDFEPRRPQPNLLHQHSRPPGRGEVQRAHLLGRAGKDIRMVQLQHRRRDHQEASPDPAAAELADQRIRLRSDAKHQLRRKFYL